MKISACWIAKNEEANLGPSIESVKDIADELIVVDTGSSDSTVALAASYGARVEYFEWINDFSAARNYALSLASGDIIIFLDADEWFEPCLGSVDRDFIIEKFSTYPNMGRIISRITNFADKRSGRIKNTGVVSRIYRNKPELRYQGAIHERISLSGEEFNARAFPNRFDLHHYGYIQESIAEKNMRNIAIMKAALEKTKAGGEEQVAMLFHLTREHFNLGEYEQAAISLKKMLKYPAIMKNICLSFNEEFINIVYVAIRAAFQSRTYFSRREIYQKLIIMFKTVYPNYPGEAEIDLLFQVYFDMKENCFLAELKSAVLTAADRRSLDSFYKDPEILLYSSASLAAWRRGDSLSVLEYAVPAMKERKHWQIALLLNAVKGQPNEDIVLFLNSIFDISDPTDLKYILTGTCFEGFRELHCYYLKRRIDVGNDLGDTFMFMLISGDHEDLTVLAAQAFAAGQANAAEYIFLAALCGAPRELIAAHAGMIEEYGHILDAFYAGERLAELTEQDVTILADTYMTVAFAAPPDYTARYLDVFRADPRLCFLSMATYCEMSGLPERIIEADMNGIDHLDFSCHRYRIQALIHNKQHTEALFAIKTFFNAEIIEQDLLHMLLVVAEKADGSIAVNARELYERYIELYDTFVDLQDVVNTGIVFDDGGKRKRRYYTQMTTAQFDKLLAEEAAILVTRELLELYRKAADVYKDQGIPVEAAHCLVRLIAHGCATEEDSENLSGLFADLRNKALPEYIRGLVEVAVLV